MRAATEWALWSTRARIVVDDPDTIERARRIADRELAAVDETVSRFRRDSELSRIADRLPEGVTISPLLAAYVRHALDAAVVTDGLVDPTLGLSLDAIGYDRDIALVMDDDTPVRAVVSPRPGWRSLRLVGNRLSLPAHLALDLGATAKALAADHTARRIAREIDGPVLVSLGGDISTAGPEPLDGWNVFVSDGAEEPGTTIRLTAGHGLATSSTLHRAWRRAATPLHHIVDPRTGSSAEPVWRTVSVAAETCVEANALSTAAIVRGESAAAWLAPRAAARLVAADGTVHTVGGWPNENRESMTGDRAETPREVRHG